MAIGDPDEAIAKVYRFTSILSWFEGGYVDVSGYMHGSHPILYGGRTVYSSLGIAGTKSFDCNHLPIIEQENARRALAFWREGQRLSSVHTSYAFLSFYKVIESQFSDGQRKAEWIAANIDKLTDRAAQRVAELRREGIEDVSRHLFESGRCAVAHASLEGEIVDPDIPADRRRLAADLVVMEELARAFIRDELKVPDSRSLYRTRDRLEPWEPLLPPNVREALRRGETPEGAVAISGRVVSVGLFPDGPIPGLDRTVMQVDGVENGVVKVVLVNERETILLVFYLDYRAGRVHTSLEEGGLRYGGNNKPDEQDVRAYATFFYNVFGNGTAELTCGGYEPVDCEVVIPVNMMLDKPVNEAIKDAVENFRRDNPPDDGPA